MEARRVLEQLAEPINAHISGHEVIEVNNKSVSWYTIETTWRRGEHTKKKQRFKYIQEALLRVRDAKERLKLNVQLPMLPLSIIRGTSEIIRAQRASEFNAFLAAALSVPQLRVLPALLLLLAPDDVGSSAPLPGRMSGPADGRLTAPSRSSSDTADVHAPHAIQSLAHLGNSDMDSTTWTSADPSAASTAEMANIANRKRPAFGGDPHPAGAPAAAPRDGGGASAQSARRAPPASPGQDSAHSHASPHDQHPALLPRPQPHSVGFGVPQLGHQFPYLAGDTKVVATAPKVAAMRAVLERCKASASTLCEQMATRDATIRQQQERIARLEEEVERLRAA